MFLFCICLIILTTGLFIPTSPFNPVATIETLNLPARFSSKVVPTKISADGSTSALILFAASSTSNKVISFPPVILISKPFAPFKEYSSIKGLEIAASAASIALFSPSASPIPIMAFPIPLITVSMSAKSKLIRPGLTIKSVIPLTPCIKTLSAILNASGKVVFSFATLKRF